MHYVNTWIDVSLIIIYVQFIKNDNCNTQYIFKKPLKFEKINDSLKNWKA